MDVLMTQMRRQARRRLGQKASCASSGVKLFSTDLPEVQMSSPHQARKAEEKLGLILGRIGSIRTRLNSLAWQRAAFGVLAWTIAIGAIVVLAAFYLQPLMFLVAAVMLGFVAIAGVTNSVRAAWRLHVSRGRAASIADRRADLKGRLETIVEIGQ